MVILSDVDAFPINKKLLDPIYENPNKKIWIYSYDDTLNHGISFNMKFTAMRSETWKNILYQANSFENLLSIFSEKLNIKTNLIVSHKQRGKLPPNNFTSVIIQL